MIGVNRTMKAIVRDEYGPPETLRLEEVDRPVPADDQVLVRVRGTSLNTADLDYLKGYPKVVRLMSGLGKPRDRLLGLDVAGTIESIGDDVSEFSSGDRVWGDLSAYRYGAFAEYVVAPARVFSPIPAGLDFERAAAMPHSAVLALQGLLGKGPVRAGEKVLIVGAGGCVGPFAVQIARNFGAEVTAVDHTGKVDMLRSIGADHVIDYTLEDVVRNGETYDLILDIAARRSFLAYRRSLAPNGRYVQIAHSLTGFFAALVLGGLVSLMGSKRLGIFMWRPSRREDLEFLGRLVLDGKLEPLIDRRYPLAEVPEALSYQAGGRAQGKVVITV
jgi:NADPH:quinone reductase-like Zn-dependent oxidoreductase